MGKSDTDLLYKRRVYMLAQTYFVKDNQQELLLHAHKYDFDMLFFDQMVDFQQAMTISTADDLFVVDLDFLNSLQGADASRKMFFGEMLRQLPQNRSYVYLETSRQGSRYQLQRTLVESNCLAYAEKPISNESLIEKLFNLFTQKRRPDMSRVLSLGNSLPFDPGALKAQRIDLRVHDDLETFHTAVKQAQPDVVIIDEAAFRKSPAVLKIIRYNVESDPSLEIILHQHTPDAALTRQATEMGMDGILSATDPAVATPQLINRINKDLINKDRATGLLNKIGFKRKAYELIRHAEQEGKQLGLCIVDIDKFKTINDTWGHYFGDIVIKRMSLLLGAYVGEYDLLSRFGGEEFVMLFWDIDRDSLMAKLNKMREAFNAIPFEVEPADIRHFAFSGGVAFFPDLRSENELFLVADEKLYVAKTNGRNQICS